MKTDGLSASAWYDGFFYDKVVAKIETRLYRAVASLVSAGSSVVDIGCGVGSLAFVLCPTASRVVGVDHSLGMVRYAKKKRAALGVTNVEFIHDTAEALAERVSSRFDLATAVMCLHEMEEESRRKAVASGLRLASRMVITDYFAPFPSTILAKLATFTEITAGKRHYTNFRDWQRQGGLDGLVARMGLKFHQRIPWNDKITELAIVSHHAAPGG